MDFAEVAARLKPYPDAKLRLWGGGDAMRWTAVQLAETLGVAAPAGLDPGAEVSGVSIDSRTI